MADIAADAAFVTFALNFASFVLKEVFDTKETKCFAKNTKRIIAVRT